MEQERKDALNILTALIIVAVPSEILLKICFDIPCIRAYLLSNNLICDLFFITTQLLILIMIFIFSVILRMRVKF